MPKTKSRKKNDAQVRRLLHSESRWLQKALFALSKVEDEHEKLTDFGGDAGDQLVVKIGNKRHDIDVVTEALRETVTERLEDLRAATRQEHALSR